MSAARDMSRAIRMELREHGELLGAIPSDALIEIAAVLQAFTADVNEEVLRRKAQAERKL